MFSKLYSGFITIAFIALALSALRSNQVAHDQAAALDKMTAKVANLQRKTEALEKQLAALPNLPAPRIVLNRLGEPAASVLPSSPEAKLPRGAVPFEFNGQTYYMVPLANSSGDSAVDRR